MENIFSWLKCHKKLDILIFIFFFIIIPTIPFIKSPIGFLSKDNAILFLSYYGTILSGIAGGALTLIGVWWTIKDQEKKRRSDLIAQYKPILTVLSKQVDFIFENMILQAKFNIKNKGRGEAMDIVISILESSCTVIPQNINSKYLTKEDETEIALFVSLPIQSSNQKSDALVIHDDEKFHFIIEITYNGAFNDSSIYKTIANVTIENVYIIIKTLMSPNEAINNNPRRWASVIHDVKYIESDIKT